MVIRQSVGTVGYAAGTANSFWKSLPTAKKAWCILTLAGLFLVTPMCARRVRPDFGLDWGSPEYSAQPVLNLYRNASLVSSCLSVVMFLLAGATFKKAADDEQERNLFLARTLGVQDSLAWSEVEYSAIAHDHYLKEQLLPEHLKPSYLQAKEEQLYQEQIARQEKRADRLERLAEKEIKALAQAGIKSEEELKLTQEDLASTLAKYTGGWTLIVAPTGCGKTNFLNSAISVANRHYHGNVDFYVVAGKDNEKGYLGLERSPADFYLCDSPEAVPGFIGFHEGVMSLLKREDCSIPVIYVKDEWNNVLLSCQVFDMQQKSKSEREKEVALSTVGGVTRGRTKRHFGWITTHSPDVGAIGLPEKIKHSCTFIVLGRSSLNGILYEAVKGKQTVIQDDRLRKKLLAQLDAYYDEDSDTDKERVVALTNLGGQWRLVILPRYPDQLPEIDRTAYNQSTAEILGDTEQESLRSTQPIIQPSPIAPAPSLPPQTQSFFEWLRDNLSIFPNGWVDIEIALAQWRGFDRLEEFGLFLVDLNRLALGEFQPDSSMQMWRLTGRGRQLLSTLPDTPATPKDELPEHLALILELARENHGPITVRSCQRATGKFTPLKRYSADELKQFFDLLAQAERAVVTADPNDSRRVFLWTIEDWLDNCDNCDN
jgi:energy-coupling factor transporter ATP-binding protein EcfA2